MIFSRQKDRSAQKDRQIMLSNFPSSSRFAEAYRSLRTNLFFSSMEKDISSVVVTSSVEGEGKTTTSVNLGFAIARTNRSVLLVDMDLRRPYLTTLFDMKKEAGVSDLVADTFGTHMTNGLLTDYSVNDLICLTRLQGRTCRLDIENESTRAVLFFEKGRIIDIYWKNRPDSKKLASTLIREKLLTEKEAYLALGHQKKSVQRLGTILYTMGFVSKKEISKALSVHTIEAIKAVSSMVEGTFGFSGVSVEDIRQSIAQEIDFDKLYVEFNVRSGRSDFLIDAIRSAIKPSGTDNLDVLPSGFVPPNPSELVGSDRTTFLINTLKDLYDFIIIDTPPVIPATDAILAAPRTDGTILVVKSGNTDRKIIQDALGQFEKSGLSVIGMVLNRVNVKKEGYYRYYNRYYSSYYGK